MEKDTIFHHLVSQNFHEKSKCVLITGRGVPDVFTRIMLRKYSDLLSVPIYALMDGSPSGAQIFRTYCFGSNEKVHENLFLPAQGLGLFVRVVCLDNRSALTNNDQNTLFLKMKYIDRIVGLRENLVFMDETKSKAHIEMMIRQQSQEFYILKSVHAAKNRRKVLEIEFLVHTMIYMIGRISTQRNNRTQNEREMGSLVFSFLLGLHMRKGYPIYSEGG